MSKVLKLLDATESNCEDTWVPRGIAGSVLVTSEAAVYQIFCVVVISTVLLVVLVFGNMQIL